LNDAPISHSLFERVDLDHRRHDVPRDQRVAHPVGRLDDGVADVGHDEVRRLAARLVDAVGDLLDEAAEWNVPGWPIP
jgi:hypothetical protein